MGVVTTTTSTSFNCQEMYDDYEKWWPVRQQHWCCKQEGLGCSPTTVAFTSEAPKLTTGVIAQPGRLRTRTMLTSRLAVAVGTTTSTSTLMTTSTGMSAAILPPVLPLHSVRTL